MAPVVGAAALGLLDKATENPAGLARASLQFVCVAVIASGAILGFRGYYMEKNGLVPPPTYYAGAPSGLAGSPNDSGGSGGGGSSGGGGDFIGKPVNDLLKASNWPKSTWGKVRYIIKHESNGIANASPETLGSGYYHDSNYRAGTPTIGLMQIITYNDREREAMKDPLANVNKGYEFYKQRGWQPWTTAGGSTNQNFKIRNA